MMLLVLMQAATASPISQAVESFAGYGVVGAVAVVALYIAYVKDQALAKEKEDRRVEVAALTEKSRVEIDALQEKRRQDALELQRQLKAESDARIKDTQEGNKMLLDFQKNAVEWSHNAATITEYLDDQRRAGGTKP